ncbi:cytidine deaminase family protein [Actinomyces mediterranea]|uniref:cytidine deaminase family protein n=1 Tax=Actinomyces mediterranea TaxID=1871028 RepID=UPI0009709ADA|nr:hypothetical protein [Actinomyces mediterranea]
MASPTGWANNDAIIAAATELAATLGKDPNHTVAAAAMDLHGTIHAGVNNYHFNGGPCAELVVLGMAASAHVGPIATMVAVGDGGRGVIPPCGRCRQVLLDQHPDCRVLVPGDAGNGGIESVPICSLLPYSYLQPDEDARRFLRIDRRQLDEALAGRGARLLRPHDPVTCGPTTLVLEDAERRGFDTVPGVIDSVTPILLSEVDPRNQADLRSLYPGIASDARLNDIRFHI